jgi:hypothetical protein
MKLHRRRELCSYATLGQRCKKEQSNAATVGLEPRTKEVQKKNDTYLT